MYCVIHENPYHVVSCKGYAQVNCAFFPHISVPLERILKSVCGRKQLDPSLYAVAQPPDSAHGQPLLCHAPNMTVGDLKTYEIHLVRKDSQPKQPDPLTEEGGGEQVCM